MVVGASITVNNSRNSGSIDSGGQAEDTKLLKQILAQLKEMNKQTMVAGRKAQSGLGGRGLLRGGVAGGGIVGQTGSTILGGLAALIGGLASMEGSTGGPETSYAGRNFSYAKLSVDGVDRIAKLDSATGELLEVMSMEKAEANDIVDELGNIKGHLRNQEAESKSVLSEMEEAGGTYFTTNKILDQIERDIKAYGEATKETLRWARIAKKAQKRIAEKLARKAKMQLEQEDPDAGKYTTVFGATKGPMSMDPNAVPIFNLGDQTSQNIEKEILYSVDTSNVARNVFWSVNNR